MHRLLKPAILLSALLGAWVPLGCKDCPSVPPYDPLICIPASAGSGLTLSFAAKDRCSNCHTRTLECFATVGPGESIHLQLQHPSCPSDLACPAVCETTATTCSIPPLAVGSYAVELDGADAGTLLVTAGGASSCSLP